MKKHITLLFLLAIFGTAMAQQFRANLPKELKNISVLDQRSIDNSSNPIQTVNPYVSNGKSNSETDIGTTIYDLQSNAASPYGRLYVYPDGTKGAVYTMGKTPTSYADRGTGYVYNNGTAWSGDPANRIESVRTGWPSYAPLGANGEIVIAHQSGTTPLVVSRRATKGSGAWTQTFLDPPAGASGLLWPRMITSGADNNTVHVITLTAPTGNGGTVYMGQDGAIIYNRSTDGGDSWDGWQILPDMDINYYLGFGGDNYSFMISNGGRIGFLVCDNACDFIMMTSDDNGTTWEKTIIWLHPYEFWTSTMITSRFFNVDGSAHGAFDATGKAHVVFGVNASRSDGAGSFWYPWVDGVGYWNEDHPGWLSGDTTELDPDSLYAHGNLIGWMQDVDGNGQLDLLTLGGGYALYYLSPTSMPQLYIDNDNQNMYCVMSMVTETYNNGTQDYRHIWARATPNLDGDVWGDFYDLTGGIIHIFDECVFPSISPTPDNGYPCFTYQKDNEPGMAVRGDSDPPGTNWITYFVLEDDIVGVKETQNVARFEVSQTYPNPAVNGATSFLLETRQAMNIQVDVTSLTGQKMFSRNLGNLNAGKHKVDLNTSNLKAGVYFYTVHSGNNSVTKKLVVN